MSAGCSDEVRNDGGGECCGIAGSVEDNSLFGTVKTVPYRAVVVGDRLPRLRDGGVSAYNPLRLAMLASSPVGAPRSKR